MKYIIDVRTQDEYETGHHDGAMCHDLRLMMQGVFPDVPKDACIEIYCQSGNRSAMACALLCQEGFCNVVDLGGYSGS